MAKENFNWKSLFINEKEEANQANNPSNPASNESKFPDSQSFNNNPGKANEQSNSYINEILNVYEKGFEGLNNEGFDFFELYKSVCAVGINNPQSYQMAFAMGKSLRPELSKDFLLEKSSYYISEIEKVYQNYDKVGNAKQKELNNAIVTKKNSLSKDIESLQNQITNLQSELQTKKSELENVDLENKDSYIEIQQKIEANNIAKQKIVESINTVVSGIKQYL